MTIHAPESHRPKFPARAAFALLLALAASACASDVRPAPRPTGVVCTRCGACEEALPVTSANHVLGTIDYPDPPPVGGDHNPCWTTWGVHTEAIAPEHWVHNLEHGGIVYLYQSAEGGALPEGALAGLTALVERLPRTVLTAYPALPKTFAAVSWGHRIVSDCVDLEAAEAFYQEHFDQAPEDIPDNPTCN